MTEEIIIENEMNSGETVIPQKKTYLSKNVKYSKQQDIIIYKLFKILNLDLYNQITLREINTNKEKYNQICALLPDVRKYYQLKSPGFLYRNDVKKLPSCIIRAILSTKGVTMKSENVWSKELKKKEIVYTFDLNGYKLLDPSFFINQDNIS